MVGEEDAFEVNNLRKPDWGDNPIQVELKSSESYKDFKGLHFYDSKGNKIESERSGSGSMGIFGKRTYTVSCNLKKKVDKIVFAVDDWSGSLNSWDCRIEKRTGHPKS